MGLQGEIMRQGTTPTIRIKVPNVDLKRFKSLYVIFEQGSNIMKKETDDLEIVDNEIRCTLTQEETLNFKEGKCNIQLRAMTIENVAVASAIKVVQVYRVLDKKVIT